MFNSFTIDGFQIHGPGTTGIWLDTGADGFDGPGARLVSNSNAGEDGGRVSDLLYDMRTLSVTGYVAGDTVTEFMANRRALEGACARARDQAGRLVKKEIRFTALDGTAYVVEGQVVLTMATDQVTWAKFLITITCDDAQLFVDQLVTSGLVARRAGGGVIYPVTYPAIYDASTGGDLVVTNSGTADVWPELTFRGVMLNPGVSYQTKSAYFGFNLELGANDVLVVDMKEHTAMLNGVTSELGTKTSDSDWFSIGIGTSHLFFSTGRTSDTGTVELSFRPARMSM